MYRYKESSAEMLLKVWRCTDAQGAHAAILRIMAGPSVWGWTSVVLGEDNGESGCCAKSHVLPSSRVDKLQLQVLAAHASEVGRIKIRQFLCVVTISLVWRFWASQSESYDCLKSR